MIIDFLFLVLMAMAVFKGFSKGLVIAIFSFLAILIGIAAAMKLSTLVAAWLSESTGVAAAYLPVLAFFIIIIAVALLVRMVAAIIKKTMQLSLLGWLDKLGGIILYALLYTIILSVLLFYAAQLGIMKEDTFQSSKTYTYIKPLGPWFMNALAYIFPFFKNMFQQLQDFFAGVAQKAA